MHVLTLGNPKTDKGRALGYLTAVLHLAPADKAGVGSVCPWATLGCRSSCLNTAGRGGILKRGNVTNAIQEARIRRTLRFMHQRSEFMGDLRADIATLARMARREGLRPALRLNGTSDLAWEKLARPLMAQASQLGIIAYDYTKSHARAMSQAYHLTFSRSENVDDGTVRALLRSGIGVAVPYRGTLEGIHRLASDRWGAAVVDGDAHDLRFMDPPGRIVALRAKGIARRDTTGFVVDA